MTGTRNQRPGTRNPEPGTRNRGFTLVELMVVIAIITILATLTVTAAMKVKGAMRVRTARGDAARMAQAIETYHALMNFLPVQQLYNAETDADDAYQNYDIVSQLNGVMNRDPLFKLAKQELNQAGSFKDPWGRPYRAVMWKEQPSDRTARFFEVYSSGPNAQWEMGAGDDLVPKL